MAADLRLLAATFPTPLGALTVIRSRGGIVAAGFGSPHDELETAERRFGAAPAHDADALGAAEEDVAADQRPLGQQPHDRQRGDGLPRAGFTHDPEDLVPHELRREVRGMWAVDTWLNNTDCSARNTFDSWVTEGGRSFVRHSLIDFNGAMGSASTGRDGGASAT